MNAGDRPTLRVDLSGAYEEALIGREARPINADRADTPSGRLLIRTRYEKTKNMNYRDEILKAWLPTKWSRLIAGASLTLGAVSYVLPDFLNTINVKLPDHLTLLIRIGSPLLIWLLGSLFVLHIVVQYSKILRTKNQFPEPPQITNLPKDQIIILVLLFKPHYQKGLTSDAISKLLSLEIQTVNYHLEELERHKMVYAHWRAPRMWTLIQQGRRYLIEDKLTS